MSVYDVVIVGGGPAGLSAATVLGRSLRKVVVCDAGNPRNVRSHGLHGYLTREGMRPPEFLAVAREQVLQYGVELCEATVTDVAGGRGRFVVSALDGRQFECRRVLLATGVVDILPNIPGLKDYYGVSVHHCPYCDGWEHRGEPIAVYGTGTATANMARAMLTWSRDIVLCSDGPAQLRTHDRRRLQAHRIAVYEKKIRRLGGVNGKLSSIEFEDGDSLHRLAIFFNTGNVQRSELPARLGCNINDKGAVVTGRDQCSSVPGVYVVGDASHDAQFVVIAAAEGAKAGMTINQELQKEDLGD